MNFSKHKCTLLVLSFDDYAKLWDPCTRRLERIFSLNMEFRLLTNFKDYEKNSFSAIKVGKDLGWSNNLIKALQEIDTDYVILWLDWCNIYVVNLEVIVCTAQGEHSSRSSPWLALESWKSVL